MDAVSIQGVSHRYPPSRRGGPSRLALDKVQLTIARGELFGLLGPNGGGKSTLFHILSTVFPPTAGQVQIFGQDVASQAEGVRRKLGVVFQSPALDRTLSVEENLIHQGHLYGLRGSALNQRIRELTDRLDIAARLDDRVETLSGGLKRRVEVAKSLLHRPELLILDEPSTGLDPIARRSLRELLQDLCREGLTVLLTTHLLDEADECARVAILDGGRLVAWGPPKQLKADVPSEAVRRRLESLKLNEATLEDVFMQKTGHSFD